MHELLNNLTGKLPHTLTNDYLFHIVFQDNEKILKNLISCLLSIPISDITHIHVENPILPGDKVDEKEFILDLLLILNHNKKIHIEMQVRFQKFWAERSLAYICRAFNSLETGDSYEKISPVIHIGILSFTLFPNHPEFYSKYQLLNLKTHKPYSDKLQINVLDLTQEKLATQEDIDSGLLYWAMLFKAKTWEEIKMLAKENEIFEDVAVSMARTLSDRELELRSWARDFYERDKISTYKEGVSDGRESMATLGLKLQEQNRMPDFIKCLQDMEYCEKLMEELGIKTN